MGGLGPGIGGLEYLVIGIVALLVVGPERLPGLLRQARQDGRQGARHGQRVPRPASTRWRASPSSMTCARRSRRCGRGRAVGQTWSGSATRPTPPSKTSRPSWKRPTPSRPHANAVVLNQPEFPEPVMTPLATATAATKAPPKPRAKATSKVAPKTPAKTTAKAAKPKTAHAKAKSAPVKSANSRAPRNTKIDL